MTFRARGVVIGFLLLVAERGHAAEVWSDTSLAELLDTTVSVATKKTMSARESPAIVTVVSREEIQNAGARDLIDVLLLVPGLQLGTNSYGITSLGMRGMFGESKILVLVDGHEFNDAMLNAIVLGNTFPVDEIKKIEVIRGPGSAMYGGYAELAVINIELTNAYDLDGAEASISYGIYDKGDFARAKGHISYGKKLGELKLVLGLFGGYGQRSTKTYTDAFGSSYNLKGASNQDPFNARLDLEYRGASLNVMVDRYAMTQRDRREYIQPYATDLVFTSYFASTQYELKIGDDIATLTPRVTFKWQTPWKDSQPASSFATTHGYGTVNVSFQQTTGSLVLRSDKIPHLSLLAGLEHYGESAEASADTMVRYRFQGADGMGKVALKTFYSNTSAFAQAIADLKYVNLTVGGRFDRHSQYGTSFVPRMALTKAHRRFHFKALAARAFASPSIWDLEYTPSIKPETTTTFELEVGYLVTENISVTANVFDTTLSEQISYFVDVTSGTDGFRNAGRTRSRGAEMELRFKERWGYFNLTYAYYRPIESSPDYEVPGHGTYFLAYSPHKATLQGALTLHHDLLLAPGLVVLGPRYAYARYNTTAWDDPFRTPQLERYSPIVLANLVATYRNVVIPGLSVSLGVYNIFGQPYVNLLPLGGFVHAAVPSLGREYGLRITYSENEQTSLL